MSSELPLVSCLCPTYRRPQLLENSIACFLAQNYPADRRELVVLDDAGELQSQTGEGWTLVRTRFDDGGYSGGNGLETKRELLQHEGVLR